MPYRPAVRAILPCSFDSLHIHQLAVPGVLPVRVPRPIIDNIPSAGIYYLWSYQHALAQLAQLAHLLFVLFSNILGGGGGRLYIPCYAK